MSDKYAVITAHRTEFPVHLMCRILAVSRAGYDDAKGRALSARTTADVSPAATITDTFTACHGCYGALSVKQALRAAGHRV